MTAAKRNIRDYIRTFIPQWLADRQGFNVGFAVLYVIALICDLFVEQMYEGSIAPYPGLGTPTALGLNGRARGIVRGLLESDDDYAKRLRAWLDTWEGAGSEETLLTQLQAFLGNTFTIRHIMRTGRFVTINPDGTFSFAYDPTWDWDSNLLGSAARVTDVWIVVYVTDSRWPIYTSLSDPTWLAAWGTTQGFGVGHKVSREVVDGVHRIIASFKAAHVYVDEIIWTNDTDLFIPGSLGVIPDGNFGNWSRDNGSAEGPARLQDAGVGNYVRYWTPELGG